MQAGFTCLEYRGIPFIRDKSATSGKLYFLNENYLDWYGRTMVPPEYKGILSPIKLGKATTVEGQNAKPSDFHGFFYQDKIMMPNQAGLISRIFVVGQLVSFSPQRQGVLTVITGV